MGYAKSQREERYIERRMRHASCAAGTTTRELETLREKCFPTVRSRSYGCKIWATWLNKLSNLAQLQGQDSSFKRCFGLGWWDGTHVAARWGGPTMPPGGAYFVYFFFCVCVWRAWHLYFHAQKRKASKTCLSGWSHVDLCLEDGCFPVPPVEF